MEKKLNAMMAMHQDIQQQMFYCESFIEQLCDCKIEQNQEA